MGIGKVTAGAAVFLDRDGVVNRAVVREGRPYPPANAEQMELNPDAFTALPRLKALGFRLVVVTNQPDVARGTQSRHQVEAIHAKIRLALPIDDFVVCYHDEADGCACRKPLPGLLLDAARAHAIPLEDSFLIGDRWRDVDAGFAAGVRTVLIDYQYRERGPDHQPDVRVSSLSQAAAWIERAVLEDIK